MSATLDRGALGWGSALLAFGAVLLLRDAGGAPGWLSPWSVALLAAGLVLVVHTVASRGTGLIAPAVLLAVGGALLLRDVGALGAVPVLPTVLVIVGAVLLASALRRREPQPAPAAPAATPSGAGAAGGADTSTAPQHDASTAQPPGGAAASHGRAEPSADAARAEHASCALADASSARLALDHGAGTVELTGGAPEGLLFSGRFLGGVRQEVDRDGDRLAVTLRPPPNEPWRSVRTIDWTVAVTEQVPVELDLRTGADRVRVDATALRVPSLTLRTGASDVDLTLPARGATRVRIAAGAADIRVHVPEGVAASVRNRSALAGVHVDAVRFPRVGDGYRSPAFDTATDRAEVELEGGVASFSVD